MARQAKENTMEVEQTEEIKQERKREKRRAFGVPRSRLSVSKEIEGYHLRWINDEPGRLQQALDSDYSFVTPEEVGRISTDRDDQRVKEHVGVGRDDRTPMYAYLMKIPLEWYEEDKKERGYLQDKFDEAIRQGTLEASPNQYVPTGGIKYQTLK